MPPYLPYQLPMDYVLSSYLEIILHEEITGISGVTVMADTQPYIKKSTDLARMGFRTGGNCN